MSGRPMKLFAPSESRELGARIAARLGMAPGALEERDFEDGEHKLRPLESVRECDVYLVQSLHGEAQRSVHDKLCRLLLLAGALRDAAAARVTAVLPYLCYARKDRRTQPRDPLATRYLAQWLEAAGVDRVVLLEVHNPAAVENAFRCPVQLLDTAPLFAPHFAAALDAGPVVVMSPDTGGIKRAERLRAALAARLGRPVGSAFMEKYRSAGVVSGEAVVGELGDAQVIVFDDLISTGGTLLRAARACRARGARRVHAAAAHGLFTDRAGERLDDPALDSLVVTDSVPPWRLAGTALHGRLIQLPVAPLLAEVLARLHRGDSVVELLDS
jgi:ribose-phosphate pyrophosphokinase